MDYVEQPDGTYQITISSDQVEPVGDDKLLIKGLPKPPAPAAPAAPAPTPAPKAASQSSDGVNVDPGGSPTWQDDWTDMASAKLEADRRTFETNGVIHGYKIVGQGQYKVMQANAIGAGTLDYVSTWNLPGGASEDRDAKNLEQIKRDEGQIPESRRHR